MFKHKRKQMKKTYFVIKKNIKKLQKPTTKKQQNIHIDK